MLLNDYQIYVQSINYPTVPVGQERLRITPTPGHTKEYRDQLVDVIDEIWSKLNIKRTSDWAAEGGFIGVGEADAQPSQPLWTDEQLGIDQQVAKEIKASKPANGFMETLLERETRNAAQSATAAA